MHIVKFKDEFVNFDNVTDIQKVYQNSKLSGRHGYFYWVNFIGDNGYAIKDEEDIKILETFLNKMSVHIKSAE